MLKIINQRWVTIGSGSSILFTDSVYFFDNQSFSPTAAAGIGDATLSESFLDTFSSVFATYTGSGSIASTSGGSFYYTGMNYGTAAGALDFTSVSSTSTFTATGTVAATPEPSSLVLLATGLASVAGAARRRLRRE